jgi:hypothetical protein
MQDALEQLENLNQKTQPWDTLDLLNLGNGALAYVRPVTLYGKTLYAVHGADGQTLAVVDSFATAHSSIQDNDMLPVQLQ